MRWGAGGARKAAAHRVVDELGVLLDEVLEAALLEELELVLLHEELDLGAAAELLARGVAAHGERAACQDVLLVFVVLQGYDHLVGDEVGRVGADVDLADYAHVRARGHRLHEGLGARLLDGVKVQASLEVSLLQCRVRGKRGRLICVGDPCPQQRS